MYRRFILIFSFLALSATTDARDSGFKDDVALSLEERYYKGKLAFRKWFWPGGVTWLLGSFFCVWGSVGMSEGSVGDAESGSLSARITHAAHTVSSGQQRPSGTVVLGALLSVIGVGIMAYGAFSYWYQSIDW